MEKRCERVRILLRTLNDYLPVPTRSADEQRGFTTGPHYARCPDCEFNGFTHANCETCEGTGRVLDADHDPYDTGRDFSWMNIEDPRKRQARIRDEALRRIARDQLAREGHLDLREGYAWESRRVLMERHGDYEQLRRGLLSLQSWCPPLHSTIHDYYFSGLYEVPPQTARERIAVYYLQEQIRGPIRVPSWLCDNPQVPSFDSLADSGASSRRIAMIMGLSQRKVKRLLKARIRVQTA